MALAWAARLPAVRGFPAFFRRDDPGTGVDLAPADPVEGSAWPSMRVNAHEGDAPPNKKRPLRPRGVAGAVVGEAMTIGAARRLSPP